MKQYTVNILKKNEPWVILKYMYSCLKRAFSDTLEGLKRVFSPTIKRPGGGVEVFSGFGIIGTEASFL